MSSSLIVVIVVFLVIIVDLEVSELESVWELATTRNQSRRLFFFKYFFVKYFMYLFESGRSATTLTLFFKASKLICSILLSLPSTLIRASRNSLRSSTFMIPSSTGCVQSMLKDNVDFFFDARFAFNDAIPQSVLCFGLVDVCVHGT